MNGFHIDMNNARFTTGYLHDWLGRLAAMGYDTIVWELEDAVRWDTCPQCATDDAWSKDEFRALLQRCRDLSLTPVPLLQTLGHCEYVLKHADYAHLAEVPGRIDQYCPRHERLAPFLHRWIEEYLELFGPVSVFHIGADEAWTLGTCDKCKAYAQRHSHARLFTEHVEAVAQPLRERGIAPALWADMALRHPEALEALGDDVILFDWMYDTRRGDGKVWDWSQMAMHDERSLPLATRERFGSSLYPAVDEPGRAPQPYYTADHLTEHGYRQRVIGCPGAAAFGDSTFAPRNWYHVTNTHGWFDHARASGMRGTVLTSWTCHFFPWELQLPSIRLREFFGDRDRPDLDDYERDWFCRTNFGVDAAAGAVFWEAAGLLSWPCTFSRNRETGAGKDSEPIPLDTIVKKRDAMSDEQRREQIAWTRWCLPRYQRAAELFERFKRDATAGQDQLAWWSLAADNLIHRARCSLFILGDPAGDGPSQRDLLAETERLRRATDAAYTPIVQPLRRAEMIGWLYDAVEHAVSVQS